MNDFCVYIETTYCLNNKKITTVDCMIPSPMYLLPKHVREKAINMYKSKEFELYVSNFYTWYGVSPLSVQADIEDYYFFNHKLNQL